MRALIAALAVVAVPVAASAQMNGLTGPEVRRRIETHTVPAGAVKEAEDAVRKALGEADGARFRVVQAIEVAAVRRAPFEEPVDGPVSIVCGEFGSPPSPARPPTPGSSSPSSAARCCGSPPTRAARDLATPTTAAGAPT